MPLVPALSPTTPGGGGAAIDIPKTVFVSASIGNNATAEVGNPAKPYATAQAAYDAWLNLLAPGRLHVMDGNVGGIVLTADMPNDLHITGAGPWCELGGFTANGALGEPVEAGSGGMDGGYGWAMRITSDWSVNLGEISGNGGTGSAGGAALPDDYDLQGGNGGASSNAKLYHILCESVTLRGGDGGNEGGSSYGGNAGGAGGSLNNAILIGVHCRGDGIRMTEGTGGYGTAYSGANGDYAPTVTVLDCICDAEFSIAGVTGIVANNVAYSLSVIGGVTESNNVFIQVAPDWP